MLHIATDVPTLIGAHLKHVHVALFAQPNINYVKLHLELSKRVGLLVPKRFSTYNGLMLMILDPAATATFTV